MTSPRQMTPMNFVFLSSHHGTGASETLWLETAERLARAEHTVSALAAWQRPWQQRTASLRGAGVPFQAIEKPASLARLLRPVLPGGLAAWRVLKVLRRLRPALLYISQGNEFSALPWMEMARRQGIPCTVVTHGVSAADWPTDPIANRLRSELPALRTSFWLCQRNQQDVEHQIGCRLTNGAMVWNPLKWERETVLPWPETPGPELRLACVARLQVRAKGHDMLLQALAAPAWRGRDWRLTFYGDGPNKEGLGRLAALLGLEERVRFAGHVADLADIWRQEHWLMQPSRNEGMPMSLIEALMAGRPSLVTDVAGHAEVVTDGHNGLVAASASVPALSEALERLWAARALSPAMGAAAAKSIRLQMPADPVGAHVEQLLRLTAA